MLCANCKNPDCQGTEISCVDSHEQIIAQLVMTGKAVLFLDKTDEGYVCTLSPEIPTDEIPLIVQSVMEAIASQTDDVQALFEAFMRVAK